MNTLKVFSKNYFLVNTKCNPNRFKKFSNSLEKLKEKQIINSFEKLKEKEILNYTEFSTKDTQILYELVKLLNKQELSKLNEIEAMVKELSNRKCIEGWTYKNGWDKYS